MSPHSLISAKDVTVHFRRGGPLWRRRQSYRALRGVSLDVHKGHTVGIIGDNGAGKTTLLRVLAGITPPTLGCVTRSTQSITLLALGAGFDPVISAKNNVILNGMLHGVPKVTMLEKLDQIFGYAELRDFRDKPLKTYSSGMRSRLAFSTALFINADVVLIDEALAVGDQPFRQKAERSMGEKLNSGGTFVLVTHRLKTVLNLCDTALYLHRGEVVSYGPAKEVVQHYVKARRKSKTNASR